jgi:hypothetical protein
MFVNTVNEMLESSRFYSVVQSNKKEDCSLQRRDAV